MYQRVIICFLSLFVLSSCADGFRDYFKRSANNKLFDREGFKGDKRLPLYNQKYITKAKRNISINDVDDGLDDNEDVEYKIPSRVYKQMYLESLEAERDRKRVAYERYRAPHLSNYRNHPSGYLDLQEAGNKASKAGVQDNKKLEKEIQEIKSMLRQTQDELTKYKCSGVSAISKEEITPLAPSSNIPSKKHTKTNLQKKFIQGRDDQYAV